MTPRTDEKALKDYMTKFILERAHTFRVGHEDEDAWAAALHAKTSFKIMNRVADGFLDAERREREEAYRGGNQGPHITATEVMQRMSHAAKHAPQIQHLDLKHVKVWHNMLEKSMNDVMIYGSNGLIPLDAGIKKPAPKTPTLVTYPKKDTSVWLQETRSLTPRQQRRLNRKQKAQSKE